MDYKSNVINHEVDIYKHSPSILTIILPYEPPVKMKHKRKKKRNYINLISFSIFQF